MFSSSLTIVNLVDKELISQINQLTMYKPGVDLMEKHLITIKEDSGEHIFDDGITAYTPLV